MKGGGQKRKSFSPPPGESRPQQNGGGEQAERIRFPSPQISPSFHGVLGQDTGIHRLLPGEGSGKIVVRAVMEDLQSPECAFENGKVWVAYDAERVLSGRGGPEYGRQRKGEASWESAAEGLTPGHLPLLCSGMRVAVLNVVGLSRSLLGENMPGLSAFAARRGLQSYPPAFPAVTCTAQSSILTGKSPGEHGVVANGWYDREDAEVKFWKQSNHIVRGEKLWDTLRREIPGFTCAKLFWWYNMHSSADFTITPRPLYPADGRKFFDVHTQPMAMREEIKADLGPFPFPAFWGPAAGIASSEWIAASAKWVEEKHAPTLSLVYLPHLDYALQKDGPLAPNIPQECRKIDAVVTSLIDFYEARGVQVLVLSEYGISPVSRPIHLNRLFRERGWIQVKDELGRETLDCGGSRAFAVADHQVAHVYVNDPALRDEVRALLGQTVGIEEVRDAAELWKDGPGRERGGDFVAIAAPDAWFTYYFWNDDAKAPDYARTIDIHRKPGYDPCELFVDPAISLPKLKIAKFLLKKKLGLRALLEVIPLDASLVKGSHGRDKVPESEQPVLIGSAFKVASAEAIQHVILEAVRRT